jgi:hypothetical protein
MGISPFSDDIFLRIFAQIPKIFTGYFNFSVLGMSKNLSIVTCSYGNLR